MSEQVDRWARILPAILLASSLAPTSVRAQGSQLRAQADLEYSHSKIESTNEDRSSPSYREETDSEVDWFKQRYQIELQKELYPYLSLLGGGFFELIDSETDTEGQKTGFDEDTRRLFGELDLNNPLYTGSLAYRRTKFDYDPRAFESTTVRREEYSGIGRWRPVGFPSLDLDFSRTRTWDDEDTRDLVDYLVVAKTRYTYEDLFVDYTYTRDDAEDDIRKNGSLTQIHNGGLRYLHSFFDDRLEATAAARINYDSLQPTSTGDVDRATSSPGTPFFFTDDDDPSTFTLVDAGNPLTTINIGNGGPTNPVSVGRNFDAPTEVSVLFLYPEDSDDPTRASRGEIASVAGSFVWSVYTSDDRLTWTPVTSLVVTPYDPFDNRFEFRFDSVETRYIKVVTTPVPSLPKEIRIERLQALTTVSAKRGTTVENLTQTYNLGFQWKATDDTSASFDSLLSIDEDEPLGSRKTAVTNGIGIQHDFSPMLFGNLRVLRTDTIYDDRPDTVRHTYTAALVADYLPSVNQRLVYSGDHDREGGRSGYGNSVLLRTNAALYRDWSANLDLGYSDKVPLLGPRLSSTSFRIATSVVPHPTLNLTIDYRGSWQSESQTRLGYQQIGRFQAFWVPLRTLSLSAVLGIRERPGDGEGLLDEQNYFVNWTPFPDGQLTFALAYNETIDTNNVKTRVLTPRVDWQITHSTVLTVSYDIARIEAELETRDVQQLRASFRTLY